MKGSIDSIESMGLVDGPGIRSVVFLTGCKLRCKYCHNPEMWVKGKDNMTVDELVSKLLRFRPYYQASGGGVTFSGGEPLLQIDFLIAVCKRLKEENISIALDTAGVGVGKYDEILDLIDLVILDIKHVDVDGYLDLTGQSMDESLKFIAACNQSGKPVWIRQVVVPGVHDNIAYMKKLKQYLKRINHIERIDFLPYHKLGTEKYEALGLLNPYQEKEPMDPKKCHELYEIFMGLEE